LVLSFFILTRLLARGNAVVGFELWLCVFSPLMRGSPPLSRGFPACQQKN